MLIALLVFAISSFLVSLIVLFVTVSSLTATRSQGTSVKNFRGHFTYITDGLDQLRARLNEMDKLIKQLHEAQNHDLVELLKQHRTEAIREYDDLRFNLQRLNPDAEKQPRDSPVKQQ